MTNSFSPNKQFAFSKGMTLDAYMSNLSLQRQEESHAHEQKYQSLYQSTKQRSFKANDNILSTYRIAEVQQESADESIQYNAVRAAALKSQLVIKSQLAQQATKQTERDLPIHPIHHAFNNPQHIPTMNSTAYFSHNQQKNQFRIKHISVSPHKKSKEAITPAMTLYGHRFRSVSKEDKAVPELITFYGRTPGRGQEFHKVEGRREGRQSIKKGHLDINQLIGFEQKIKNTYSRKLTTQDLKVQGVKGHIKARRKPY